MNAWLFSTYIKLSFKSLIEEIQQVVLEEWLFIFREKTTLLWDKAISVNQLSSPRNQTEKSLEQHVKETNTLMKEI